MKLDLRPRCSNCGKLPRGKLQQANYQRYAPYCSFHCQESARMKRILRAVNDRRPEVA